MIDNAEWQNKFTHRLHWPADLLLSSLFVKRSMKSCIRHKYMKKIMLIMILVKEGLT